MLWGAGLRALGAQLGDAGTPAPETVAVAWRSWLQALVELGKAQVGDKTLLDAAVPFVETLSASLDAGLPGAWERAVAAAETAAQATAELSPKVGRARPLAARSIGHPDPGAISFVICVRAAAAALGDCD